MQIVVGEWFYWKFLVVLLKFNVSGWLNLLNDLIVFLMGERTHLPEQNLSERIVIS